jgi:hypothetical protein
MEETQQKISDEKASISNKWQIIQHQIADLKQKHQDEEK